MLSEDEEIGLEEAMHALDKKIGLLVDLQKHEGWQIYCALLAVNRLSLTEELLLKALPGNGDGVRAILEQSFARGTACGLVKAEGLIERALEMMRDDYRVMELRIEGEDEDDGA